jgi:hypothetical protein
MAVANEATGKFVFWSLAILMGAIIVRSIVAPTKDERIVVNGTNVDVEPLVRVPATLGSSDITI